MRPHRMAGGLMVLWLGVGAGCGRPSPQECEAAIANIRKITGTRDEPGGAGERTFVKKCQAQSSKASVKCWSEAQTQAELDACEAKKK